MADVPYTGVGPLVPVSSDPRYKREQREQHVIKLVEDFAETGGHVTFDFNVGRFVIDTKGNPKMYAPMKLAAVAIVDRLLAGGVPLCLSTVIDNEAEGILLCVLRPLYDTWPNT